MEDEERIPRNETQLAKRKRWEKEAGLRFIEKWLPFPDVIDTETDVLNSWLTSMEIRPNPQPGKCGFWYSPHSFRLKRTLTSDNRLIYLQRGRGYIQVCQEEKKQRFCAGDALLIPPNVHHDFVADEDAPVLFFAIHFDLRLLGGVNPLELVGFPKYLPGSNKAPYRAAARRMARESGRSLESVATNSGFVHMSHFFRTFKRWTEMTPCQFRLAETSI